MHINVALLLLLSSTSQSGVAHRPAHADDAFPPQWLGATIGGFFKRGEAEKNKGHKETEKQVASGEGKPKSQSLVARIGGVFGGKKAPKIISDQEKLHLDALKKLGDEMVKNSMEVEDTYGDIKHHLNTYKDALQKVMENAQKMVVAMPDIMSKEEKAMNEAELNRTKTLLKATQMVRTECPDCEDKKLIDPVATYQRGQVVLVPSPKDLLTESWSLGTVKEVSPLMDHKQDLVVELLDKLKQGEFREEKVSSEWWPTHVRLPIFDPKAVSYAYRSVGTGRCAKRAEVASTPEGTSEEEEEDTYWKTYLNRSIPPTSYYEGCATEESCQKKCNGDPNCVGYDFGYEENSNPQCEGDNSASNTRCSLYVTIPTKELEDFKLLRVAGFTNDVEGDKQEGVACSWKTKPV